MNRKCARAYKPFPREHACPVDGKTYPIVSRRTVLHQIEAVGATDFGSGYYFCTDSDCDVVYFGQDKRVIVRDEMRSQIGQKSRDHPRPVCYCFDVRGCEAMADDCDAVRQSVVDHTRNASCDCEIRNPSGRCFLRDFPER